MSTNLDDLPVHASGPLQGSPVIPRELIERAMSARGASAFTPAKPSPGLLADLLDCPETVHVEIGGAEHPFLLSVYACEIAAAAGHDPLPLLTAAIGDLFGGEAADVDVDALKADPSAAAARLASSLPRVSTQTLSALATTVWAGFLPFGYSKSLEAFKATTSPVALGRIVMAVLGPILKLVRAAPEGEEEAEGDAPGKP